MPDINHLWGGDIVASPAGDLSPVDGANLSIQRLIRRLMTRGAQAPSLNNPARTAEYIWDNAYGAGLPERVGDAFDYPAITAIIQSQILLEDGISQSPPPIISFVASAPSTLTVSITYNDKVTGQQQLLTFDVNQ